MADHHDPENEVSLYDFTNTCPPGWDPAVAHRYPLRRYLQLLQLWNLQTDMGHIQLGPNICGRLLGAAYQYAMQLNQARLSTTTGALESMHSPELFA